LGRAAVTAPVLEWLMKKIQRGHITISNLKSQTDHRDILAVMRTSDGDNIPNLACFLHIITNSKI
jgi:hypothetical protein